MFSGCGIAGVLRFDGNTGPQPGGEEVHLATGALAHRGPDGHGQIDTPQVTLGHRRLSVLGLGETGAQPMTRAHLTLTYNGELYNFADLRQQLRGDYHFESATDTEVVLRAWQRWGADALDRFHGMYAFALWDDREHCLHLVRDRLGLKPLYLYRGSSFLAFASEIEALLHIPQVPRQPDEETLHHQLLCSSTLHIDAHRTLVRDITALAAGSCLTIDARGRSQHRTYWRLPTHVDTRDARADGSARLEQLLHDSVTSMLTADVPVAAFLSGGLDSSAIIAIAAQTQPITAVTLSHTDDAGAPDAECGEDLRYSRILASHLGGRVDHRVIAQATPVTLDGIDAICDLAALADDPRHLNILGNYRAIHDLGLRVVLNGQGADEIMGGYIGLPEFAANLLDVRRPSHSTIRGLPTSRQAPRLSDHVLAERDDRHEHVNAFYTTLPGPPAERVHRFLVHTQLARVVQFEDFLSMRASVECQPPFLDHRVVEWCFSQPFEVHIDHARRQGKSVLRQAMRTQLPRALLTRRKQKFPAPNPGQLRRNLSALVRTHEAELRADSLVSDLFALPGPGQLASYPTQTLWLLLTTWRWHDKLRHPTAPTHIRASQALPLPATT
jgi:asparagine synthase (glutamine-hydrolysing)